MKEKLIEAALVKAVKDNGGLCLKLVSPSLVCIPDRLILMDDGRCAFVEVKATGKKPRLVQEKRMRQLQQLGFKVFALDNLDEIATIIGDVMGGDAL